MYQQLTSLARTDGSLLIHPHPSLPLYSLSKTPEAPTHRDSFAAPRAPAFICTPPHTVMYPPVSPAHADGSVASPSSAALYQRDSLLGTPSSHGYQGAASAGSVERVGSGTGGAGGGAAAVRYAQQMQSPDSYRGGSP
eukprot:scaffold137794_cov21-Tisochrysis_lutea.AAC.1